MAFLKVNSTSVTWGHTNRLVKIGLLKRSMKKSVYVTVVHERIHPPFLKREKEEVRVFVLTLLRNPDLYKRKTIKQREVLMDPEVADKKAAERALIRRHAEGKLPLPRNKSLRETPPAQKTCLYPLWGDSARPEEKEFCGKSTCIISENKKSYCLEHWRMCVINSTFIESGRKAPTKVRHYSTGPYRTGPKDYSIE